MIKLVTWGMLVLSALQGSAAMRVARNASKQGLKGAQNLVPVGSLIGVVGRSVVDQSVYDVDIPLTGSEKPVVDGMLTKFDKESVDPSLEIATMKRFNATDMFLFPVALLLAVVDCSDQSFGMVMFGSLVIFMFVFGRDMLEEDDRQFASRVMGDVPRRKGFDAWGEAAFLKKEVKDWEAAEVGQWLMQVNNQLKFKYDTTLDQYVDSYLEICEFGDAKMRTVMKNVLEDEMKLAIEAPDMWSQKFEMKRQQESEAFIQQFTGWWTKDMLLWQNPQYQKFKQEQLMRKLNTDMLQHKLNKFSLDINSKQEAVDAMMNDLLSKIKGGNDGNAIVHRQRALPPAIPYNNFMVATRMFGMTKRFLRQ